MRCSKPTHTLFCRESGSTLRFLIPVAMLSGNETVFGGADGLMRRPMTIYEDLSAQKRLTYQKDNNQITVAGPLKSGKYTLEGNVSSQFISGLLFALPLLEGDSEIHLLPGYEGLYNIYMMEEIHSIFAAGAGAVTKMVNYAPIDGSPRYIARSFNPKYPYEYLDHFDADAMNKRIVEVEAFYRDNQML